MHAPSKMSRPNSGLPTATPVALMKSLRVYCPCVTKKREKVDREVGQARDREGMRRVAKLRLHGLRIAAGELSAGPGISVPPISAPE